MRDQPLRSPIATMIPGNSATEWLECLACHQRYPLAPMFFGCPACSAQGVPSPVEVRYAPRTVTMPETCVNTIWAWNRLLPTIGSQDHITLGEGGTSMLALPVDALGAGSAVFLKNETTNPTWSWKDRCNAVSVSMARHFGYRNVVSISTGNHGNAMAAMAGAAGIQSIVFCKPDTPSLQIALMQLYGARVVLGGDAEAMVLALVQAGHSFPCTILNAAAGYSNPFAVEGFKTIAFEILQQLGRIPDRVFVPVGSGDGIYGIWKGFRELRDCGAAAVVPRIYGCQTHGANSLVRAFLSGRRTITPLAETHTVAASLAELAVSQTALTAVYESGGAAIEVSDEEALAERQWLARRGIALEPSSAVSLACLRQVRQSEGEKATAGETWIFVGSGAAPKWPEDVLRGFVRPDVLPDGQAILQQS